MTDTVTATEGRTGSSLETLPPQHHRALERVELLRQALVTKDPMMPQHLSEIHKILIEFEEVSSLLREEEIGIIVEAQTKHSGQVLIASTATKSGKTKAARESAKLQLSDL